MSSELKVDEVLPIKRVDPELEKELLRDYMGEKSGWYFIGDKQYLFPSKCGEEMEHYYNFPVRSDDIWISTFPRSGTTLTQELVWLLVNNFNFEVAKKKNVWERSPFFELNIFFHEKTKAMLLEENKDNAFNQQVIYEMSKPGYEIANYLSSPRVIKTHFPLSLLPRNVHKKKVKIIYVARNPRDVVISYFYLFRLWRTSDYVSSFEKFWKQFQQGHVPWGPFWAHIQEAWDRREDSNILFIFYEDMVKDMDKTIMKIASFLSVPAPQDKVKELKEHLDVKNFSNNPAVNYESLRDLKIFHLTEKPFVRKGAAREKPPEMTDEIEIEIKEWINKNYGQTDLRFPKKN